MIGIIVMSHGEMAAGLADTCRMIMCEDIPQFQAVCFREAESLENLDEKIEAAIAAVDDGHGVLGFCDLQGGTPFNRGILKMSERFQLIAGMNLPIILEALQDRMGNIDISELDIDFLLETGKENIMHVNRLLSEG